MHGTIAKLILQQPLNSDKPSPTEKILDIMHSSYDYQTDHIFYDDYVQQNSRYYEFTFYLDECDQPARTRETLRKLQDLIEDYL